MIISLLKNSKYGKSAAGQQELLDFISEIMELDRDFDQLEQDVIQRVIICTTYALPLFSVSCLKFIICVSLFINFLGEKRVNKICCLLL